MALHKRIATFLILVGLMMAGRTGLTATWQGDDATSPNDWRTAENWDTGVVPGVGGTVGENVLLGAAPADVIDLNGTSVTVGEFKITQTDQDFLTTGGAATINCTRFYIDEKDFNTEVWPDLVVTNDIFVRRKSGNQTFYGSVTAAALDLGQSGTTFSGPVTVTGANGVEVFFRSISQGSGVIYTFNSTITSANGGAVYSSSAGDPARLITGAANTLGGITGALDINANGQLELGVAPTAFPSGSIVINQYGLLVGDSGAATWGSGSNIDVTDDGILALTAGTVPTAGDIGVGVCWKGVVSDGLTEAGNDGVGVYKGLAVGGFDSTLNGYVLQSPAGAGDVEVLVLPGINSGQNQSVNLRSVDGTGIANIYCVGAFPSKGGRFNPAADPSNAQRSTSRAKAARPSSSSIFRTASRPTPTTS